MQLLKYLLILWISLEMMAMVPPTDHPPTPKQEKAITNWLSDHLDYRLAIDSDCEDDIKQMRAGYGGDWKPVPNYRPYMRIGDFNGDGIDDIAAVLVNKKKDRNNFAMIIFNGPFERDQVSPAYFATDLDLKYKGMFYGPPRQKPL
jgi:hypothetical protein